MSAEREKPMAEADVKAWLAANLPAWKLEDGWIRRTYKTASWKGTLMVVNTIGHLAEAAWHHPDLEVTWGKVWVKLRTHSSNGVTERDFALARRIEETVLWKPDAASPMEGTPNKWVKGGSPDRPA